MRRFYFSIGLMCLLLALTACTGDDPPSDALDDDPAAHTGVTTVEGLFEAVNFQTCHMLFRCLPHQAEVDHYFGDEQACRTSPLAELTTAGWFGARRKALVALEAKGRVHVDSKAVEKCFARFGECGNFLLLRFVDCVGAIVGAQALGEDCTLNEECSGDAYCNFTDQACPGVCAARVALGAACNEDNDRCTGGRAVSTCKLEVENGKRTGSGQCVKSGLAYADAEGEPCGYLHAGTFEQTTCPPGLYCDFDGVPTTFEEFVGTCQPAHALGEACDVDIDVCEDGACVGMSGSSGTCQRFEWRSAGEACDATSVQGGCDVAANQVCSAGHCTKGGDGTEGSLCDERHDSVLCKQGFRCAEDKCTALRAAGAACEINDACTSGACDPTTKTCREQYCDAW